MSAEPRQLPWTLRAAALLNVVVGLGLLGIGVVAAVGMVAAAAASDLVVGVGVVLLIPVLGALAAVAGIGLWRGSLAGWWLALVTDSIGLAVLVWAAGLRLEPALLVAEAIGVAMVALVMARSTRRAIVG